MKYACWRLAPPCPEGRRALEEAGLPSLLAGVLSARGIAETGQARRLLSPEGEPIPNPELALFRSFPNVILTDHTAFYTQQNVESMVRGVFESADAFSKGEATRHDVSLK